VEEIIVHVHLLLMPKRAYSCCTSINDIHYYFTHCKFLFQKPAFLGDLLYENVPAFRKYYSTIYMQVVKMSMIVCVGIILLTTNMF
jgi:hypothetical protein